MDEPTKPCRECGAVLPLIDFPQRRDQADGHHWWCFPCKRAKDRAYGAKYGEKHPEERRRSGRRHARKEAVRAAKSDRNRLKKYGLTPEGFAAKLEEQGGHCPFCPPDTAIPEAWDVDHDHRCCPGQWSCGRCVRAILCRLHNRGLGAFGDDPELLRAAADYIERHQQRIASAEPLRVKAAKSGEGHQAWKGEDATPSARHMRIWRAKGKPSGCVNRETADCTSEHFEWVPLKDADRNNPDSYVSMCKRCRLAYEGRVGGGGSNASLTDAQAAEVRERYAAGGVRQAQLAAEFGVSQGVISNIVRGTSYADSDFTPRRPAPRRDVGYSAMRKRITRLRGPADHCEQRETVGCSSDAYHWVLTAGTDPGDPMNYHQLCSACSAVQGKRAGASNARAKLTMNDARAIRAWHAAGTTQLALASEYEVTQATISNIILHRRYREDE